MRLRRMIAFVAMFSLGLGAGFSALAADVPPVVSGPVPSTVEGKVFLDANGNGKPDAGEKGLSGIRVTDGVNFVATGQDGSYSIQIAADPVIPYKPSQVVAMSWPSGKWPTGRWWARMDQIADARHVDFGLRDDKQAVPFSFLHITDDHGSGGAYDVIAPRIQELSGSIKLCFNTGDMGYASPEGADAMFTSLRDHAGKFPVPMFCVPGNHDIVGGHGEHRLDPNPLAGNGAFTKYLGPVRWSFDYAGAHFVGVDWMDPTVPAEVNGSVPRVAADWLEKDLKDLKPGTRIFLFVHFPTGCQKYFDVISQYKVSEIFGGHNHRHAYYNYAGVPAVTSVNPEPGGSGNLCVVGKAGFDVVFYCNGGKGGPGHHGKLCGLSWEAREFGPLKARRGKAELVSGVMLDNCAKTVAADPAQGVEIVAAVAVGSAETVGLRIGQDNPVEIAFTGRTLNAAGTPIPFILRPEDAKTLKLHVAIDGGTMTLYANGRIRLVKAVQVDNAAAVTLFAQGGSAEFKSVDVCGLKGN